MRLGLIAASLLGLTTGLFAQSVPAAPNTHSPVLATEERPQTGPMQDGLSLDPSSVTVEAVKPRSTARRMIDKLTPHCLDAAVESCWSSPVVDPRPRTAAGERQFKKDVEAAQVYFEQHNYRAALSRYESALEYLPHDPEAMFRSAQCLEKLNVRADARADYAKYLQSYPSGRFAAEAKKALQRLN
jgi:tetratricopeptide (TPR) repeat protein